ncbi:MAG: prephenate dehydrogenase/arogenate dehydrogenase family protein [Candidatus Thorarchaeota archaeon]
MRIAILGGAGEMGSWLVGHFADTDHSLIISDPEAMNSRNLHPSCNIEMAVDNIAAVENADFVFVSVPMNKTAAVIREVIPHMRKNAVVCEISSSKTIVLDALKEAAKHAIQPLSTHPMFGPGATSLHKKILLIPIIHRDDERELVESVFPDAEIIPIDAAQHERVMTLTLSLPYFMNMVLASILIKEDIQVLKRMGGTTFDIQSVLTASIMAQSADLHYFLHTLNPQAMDLLTDLPAKIDCILGHLTDGNRNRFRKSYERIKNTFERSMDSVSAYEEMYRILECMDGENNSEGEP